MSRITSLKREALKIEAQRDGGDLLLWADLADFVSEEAFGEWLAIEYANGRHRLVLVWDVKP